MSSDSAIGGYFELSLPKHNNFPHGEGIMVNSGRCALEYALRSIDNVAKIFVPYYTCSVILEPLKSLSIPHEFYRIDEFLHISDILFPKENEYVLYTNYFGVMDMYLTELSSRYRGNLIIDNAQALFSEPLGGIPTVYSPRKFVGMPDGGIVCNVFPLKEVLVQDHSSGRAGHLLERLDGGAEHGYSSFRHNDASLSGEPLKRMSNLSRAIMGGIDFEEVRRRRIDNFQLVHHCLNEFNLLRLDDSVPLSPLAYPLRVKNERLRRSLIQQRVFVPTYWPNVFDWCTKDELEFQLATEIIPLPIDQRYGTNQVMEMIDIVLRSIK